MANPVWHCSSSVCHDYSSSQDGQSQRNSLSSLPESTPRIASQNLVFLWTVHHSALESLLKFQDFIPLLVYSNDKKPAVYNLLAHLNMESLLLFYPQWLFADESFKLYIISHFTPKTYLHITAFLLNQLQLFICLVFQPKMCISICISRTWAK